MNKKGQLSLVFVLIMVVILLFMQTIILPSVDIAVSSAKDVKKVSEVSFAAEKLADTINYVASSSGDTIHNVSVYIPEGAALNCEGTVIRMTATLERDAVGCANSVDCEKTFPLVESSSLSISCSTPQTVNGPKMQKYMISKIEGDVFVQPK